MNARRIAEGGLLLCAVAVGFVLWLKASAERAAAPEPLQIRRPTAAVPARLIRVGLSVEPVNSIEIEVSEPFRLRSVDGSRLLREGSRLARITVTTTPRGLRLGAQEYNVSQLELVPTKSPAVWVDGHQYRGSVRLYRRPGGKILAVNALPVEEYVASVVDSEMPRDFPEEARKAQAVIARTYALYQIQVANADAVCDLFASTKSQKYLGFQYRAEGGRLLAGESADSRRIVSETRGVVCTYQGKLFCTYYCAVCGGQTVKGTEFFDDAAPPLVSVPCDWCREARLYRWTAEVPRSSAQTELRSLLMQQGKSLGTLKGITPLRPVSTGGLPEFDIRGDRQSARVSGADLRQAWAEFGLYSPRFTIRDTGKAFVLSGQGHGHGVGLCQWGARGQAAAGKTYPEILAHYYPGTKLVTQR